MTWSFDGRRRRAGGRRERLAVVRPELERPRAELDRARAAAGRRAGAFLFVEERLRALLVLRRRVWVATTLPGLVRTDDNFNNS